FALLVNFGSSYLLLAEYRHLGSALTSGGPSAVAEVGPLRHGVGWQMVLNLALSLVLAACVASIWWLRRRYMASQNSLRQVKMLAHDILASMGDGVVTADREGTITSINTAGIRLLGVDFDCVGQPLASVSRPETPLVEVYRDVVLEQGAVLGRDF